MTTAGEEEGNVVVLGTEGSSDDLDRPMEAVFADTGFKRRHQIGSINSVNICRVLVQVGAAGRTAGNNYCQHLQGPCAGGR